MGFSGRLHFSGHYRGINELESKRPLNPIPILIRFRFPAVWQ